jgi:hypothetical protein
VAEVANIQLQLEKEKILNEQVTFEFKIFLKIK